MTRFALAAMLALLPLWTPLPVNAETLDRQQMIAVQAMLSDMGYDLAVDGVMGPGTARAIREFQGERGLPVDGEPSTTLIAQLEALMREGWYRTGGPAGEAQGPSFDCAKAGNPSERAICGDAGLAFLDREVAKAYSAAAARGSDADRRALRERQRTWIEFRDRCEADVQCLRFAMEARVDQLK